ncbi:MAG: EamA family transporter [Jatrophihabitans sp.]|uniref:EamA family transporter n=1 Tax=Jatrophihabitans sp. TaxID=1932789 RepID=UPI003F80B175
MSRAPLPPELLVVAGMGSVQFGSAFADTLFPKAGPAGVTLLRLVFSGAILLAIARPRVRGRSRADLLAAAAFGVILGTMNWSFYEAINRIPLGVAVTIEFVGPLVVAVLGSRRRLDALWIVLAAGGVALLASGSAGSAVHPLGILLVLVAATCWGCYILLSKRVGAAFAQLDGLALALGVGTFVVLPAGVVEGGSALLHGTVLAGGLGVGLMSSLIPYSLELIALRTLTPARFGLLMCLQPAVATLAGVLVLGERITLVLVLALLMVVTASAGSTLTARRPPLAEPEA